MKRSISLIFMVLMISACSHINNTSYFQNRNNAYMASSNAPKLVVPDNLSREKIKDYYVIKPVEGKPGIKDVPPGMKVANSATTSNKKDPVANKNAKVIIIKARPTLVLNENSRQSWQAVGMSLKRLKIPVLLADNHNQTYLINEKNVYLINTESQSDASTMIFVTDKDGKKVADTESTNLLTAIANELPVGAGS